LILGGGARSRGAKLAARWADEYNVNFVEPDECRAARERLTRACEDIGRDPAELPLSLMAGTVVGVDQADLQNHASRLMERRGETGDAAAVLESLGPKRIVGTPDRVLARLEEYSQAGVQRVMMQHLVHDDLEALALIGSEIIPEAAGL
jgi:alkanesulfonate monooxygenase SsuD/methylene tetrahydromethanopterin reductase-like flavin-dependent oxidoreductase (luciferase family)